MDGTVKFWLDRRGWGYVTGEDGNDYFVHHSGVTGDGGKAHLTVGGKVTFKPLGNDRGRQAVNVEKGEDEN